MSHIATVYPNMCDTIYVGSWVISAIRWSFWPMLIVM